MPRLREYHLPLHLPHIDLDHQLRWVYFLRLARRFTNSLSLFFLPIFLYSQASRLVVPEWTGWYQLSNLQQGICVIAGFYIMSRSVTLMTAIPIGKVLSGRSFGRVFFLAQVVYAAFFLALFGSLTHLPLLAVAAAIEGIQNSLFWNPYHTLLATYSKPRHVAQNLGIVQFGMQLIDAGAPAVGGLIAGLWGGFGTLFFVGILLSLLGMIAALGLPDTIRIVDGLSWREFFRWLRERRFDQLALSFAGRYINDATIVLWPLYIYFVLGSLERVGFLYSISLFLALFATFFLGIYIDSSRDRRPFVLSGGMLGGLWLMRVVVITPIGLALLEFADRLIGGFYWLYFDAIFIRRGVGSRALAYFVYREIILSASALVFWIVCLALFYFTSGWNAMFILAAVGVVLSILIKDKP